MLNVPSVHEKWACVHATGECKEDSVYYHIYQNSTLRVSVVPLPPKQCSFYSLVQRGWVSRLEIYDLARGVEPALVLNHCLSRQKETQTAEALG